MTLSISVIENMRGNRQAVKTWAAYLLLSAFCILFDRVYALYGHGVSSPFMSLMFLYPLLMGFVPFAALCFLFREFAQARHYRFYYNAYNSGIASITVASLLNGIFEIAGTDSPYVVLLTLTGWAMAIFGACGMISGIVRLRLVRGKG